MKILVVGDGRSKIHEKSLAQSLKELGHEIHEFYWCAYFQGRGLAKLSKRVQERFLIGPTVSRLNADFEARMDEIQPEVIFIYRGTLIDPNVISRIRTRYPKTAVLGYNNDDPFSPQQSRFAWRKFLRALPFYDLVYAYRPINQIEFLDHGAKRSKILKPWFAKELHYPMRLTEEDQKKFACDVVFIGHFESDWRGYLIEKLVDAGVHVRLFGPSEPKLSGWELALERHPKVAQLGPFRMLWGEEYNKAISGAKIALCFLSKLNRDKYTRRCFEIPAIGGFLFSEYSPELAGIFAEGKEAEYFRDEDEFMDKILYYLNHAEKRDQIAGAGYKKVTIEGHDATGRARQIVDDIREFWAGANV